jgi:hypothetical protein
MYKKISGQTCQNAMKCPKKFIQYHEEIGALIFSGENFIIVFRSCCTENEMNRRNQL